MSSALGLTMPPKNKIKIVPCNDEKKCIKGTRYSITSFCWQQKIAWNKKYNSLCQNKIIEDEKFMCSFL